MEYIITCDEQSQNLCSYELKKNKDIIIKKWLTEGIVLVSYSKNESLDKVAYKTPLVFVRHIFEVQNSCKLDEDFVNLIKQNANSHLDKSLTFSIQLRKTKSCKLDNTEIYSIADYLTENGYKIDIKNCEQTISVFATETDIYFGTSIISKNLSKYKGGAPHYLDDENTISRAEYKLKEAIEIFSINFDGLIGTRHAIDLGSAPGGWTKVLAQMGLSVFAVDPAKLDERVLSLPTVKHYKITSQEFLHRNFNIKFDILVNDMKMDMFESIKITNSLKNILHDDAHIIITLKLPMDFKLSLIQRALSEIKKTYTLVSARQLFHNRNEITVYAINNK